MNNHVHIQYSKSSFVVVAPHPFGKLVDKSILLTYVTSFNRNSNVLNVIKNTFNTVRHSGGGMPLDYITDSKTVKINSRTDVL